MSDQNHSSTQSPYGRPLRTVLIGTLLDRESDQVVRGGLALARAAGAQVHLVHATEKSDSDQQEISQAEADLKWQVDRLGIEKAELNGNGMTALPGDPHEALIETEKRIEPDLIVVGATRSGLFEASTLGRVLLEVTCPVLVIRSDLQLPLRRVLVPVDLDPDPDRGLSIDVFRCGLDFLAQVAKPGEVELQAFHVAKDSEVERKTEDLHDFVEASTECLTFGFEVKEKIRPGTAGSEILQELEERPADLTILGHRSRFIESMTQGIMTLGSVALEVTSKAPCSVLLISQAAAVSGPPGDGHWKKCTDSEERKITLAARR